MTRPADFWARRRAGVAAEARAEEMAQEATLEAEVQAQQAEKTDAELLVELELPDPDTLKLGDDIKGFMAKSVPDRLRRRALRQLWKLNPVLANVDGLVDYGEDFTDSATVVENLQTAYQVGKGMLKHIEEMARQAEAAANPDLPRDPAPEESTAADTPADMAAIPEAPSDVPTAPVDLANEAPHPEHDPLDSVPPKPRRMQFTFSPPPETA